MQELYRDYVRNEPKAEVVFDGRKLTWFENGKPVKSWPAMSGHADYQNVWSQGIKNKGPIPEGEWTIAARDYDEVSGFCDTVNPFELVWKRNPRAWGTKRIALRPKDGTDPLG